MTKLKAKTIAKAKTHAKAPAAAASNPLLARWSGQFGIPPFQKIKTRDFKPAFTQAFAEAGADIDKIAANQAKPTFVNTIVALEKSGQLLQKVCGVFFNLEGADTTPALQALARDLAPKLARHETAVLLNAKLFKRIDELYQNRDALDLSAEERRVLERHHLTFFRAGAKLSTAAKKRVKEINERLASLVTQFMQNVLKDEQSWQLVLDDEKDFAGLSDAQRDGARQAAEERGLSGSHVITLARSSVEGFLTFSTRRDLREQAWRAWIARGANGGETDNRAIVAEVAALRTEYAKLMGSSTFADFSLADTMAKTPAAVAGLLGAVWPKALARAEEERRALEKVVKKEGGNFAIAPWDWRHYAEKVRKAKFDLSESEVRPYLQLNQIINASFDCAKRLFGLRFNEIGNAPRYHPDARTWDVTNADGSHVGVFIGDYFARPSKRSGAWMSAFRGQHNMGRGQRPIIVNVMNFTKGGEGEPSLLSIDDARTLFHEFGHGLHGLLSDVTYPSISGTSVSGDFVELPSQLYEHWLMRPEVLKRFARHSETGAPMPDELLARIEAARNFNQGFTTVEYTSSALLDMELYALEDPEGLDVDAFEKEALDRLSMPDEIVMRHRLPHFMHIIGGYAAGYYSYMWSEVMDADAFAAFEEAGDIFHKPTARKLKEFIYSAGNSRDPADAYTAFRGRPPKIEGLLKKRGFAET